MSITPLITIGTDKNGEFDFAVSALIQNLSFREKQELMSMAVTALTTAHNMWRDNMERNSQKAGI